MIVLLSLTACATPKYHLTQSQLDAGIEACQQKGAEIEITVSEDGHSAIVACVWR